MEIHVGDTVKLAGDAVYYDGSRMPEWVKQDRWIVAAVKGDKAVIDYNESGTHAICSSVRTSFLTVLSSKEDRREEQGQSAPGIREQPRTEASSKPEAADRKVSSGQNMQVSENGVRLVAKYEGCRLQAYKCPAGIWTIGYGHTAGVKEGDTLPSKESALSLLKQDLAKYGARVNACVQKGQICFPLTQNQFDALTSFCYNCGAGSLAALVRGRSPAEVADCILKYNKGGGKVLPGLVRRRQEERELFLK